jgi:hypothetical protein
MIIFWCGSGRSQWDGRVGSAGFSERAGAAEDLADLGVSLRDAQVGQFCSQFGGGAIAAGAAGQSVQAGAPEDRGGREVSGQGLRQACSDCRVVPNRSATSPIGDPPSTSRTAQYRYSARADGRSGTPLRSCCATSASDPPGQRPLSPARQIRRIATADEAPYWQIADVPRGPQNADAPLASHIRRTCRAGSDR